MTLSLFQTANSTTYFSHFEDMTGNLLHYLLFVFCIFCKFIKKISVPKGLFNGYSFYNNIFLLIKWQPWINRLTLPFFILNAPLLIVFTSLHAKVRNITMFFLIIYALPFLLMNQSRPVIEFSKDAKISKLYEFNKMNLKFSNPLVIMQNRENFYSENSLKVMNFDEVSQEIKNKNCKVIDLVGGNFPNIYYDKLNINEKDFEYSFHHYDVKNISKILQEVKDYDCFINQKHELKMIKK